MHRWLLESMLKNGKYQIRNKLNTLKIKQKKGSNIKIDVQETKNKANINYTFLPSHRNPVVFILIDGEVYDRYFCR